MLLSSKTFQVLLADDDSDDRYFFQKILEELPYKVQFTTVEDGEKLMAYLSENIAKLPDVLFLDQNMPRENGYECLTEIKLNPKLKNLPVVIYSTHVHEDLADMFYETGALFYIRKTNLTELKKILRYIFTLLSEKRLVRPMREKFILSLVHV